MTDQPLYTLRDIARELQLPESTVRYYRDAFAHQLPTVGTGRRRRYPQDAVASLRLIAMWYAEGRSREEIERELAGHPTAEIQTPRPRIPYRDAERPGGGLGAHDVLQTVLEGERERRHAMWQMAREIVRLSEMLDRQQSVLDNISDRLTVLSERALPSGAAAPPPPPAAARAAPRPEPAYPEEPPEEPEESAPVGLGVDAWTPPRRRTPEPRPAARAPESPTFTPPPPDSEPAMEIEEEAEAPPGPEIEAHDAPTFRPTSSPTERESIVVPELDEEAVDAEWEAAVPGPAADVFTESYVKDPVEAEVEPPAEAIAEPPAVEQPNANLLDLRHQLDSLREELANEKDLVERLRRSKLELERRAAEAEERASLERGGRRSMFGRLLGGEDDDET